VGVPDFASDWLVSDSDSDQFIEISKSFLLSHLVCQVRRWFEVDVAIHLIYHRANMAISSRGNTAAGLLDSFAF